PGPRPLSQWRTAQYTAQHHYDILSSRIKELEELVPSNEVRRWIKPCGMSSRGCSADSRGVLEYQRKSARSTHGRPLPKAAAGAPPHAQIHSAFVAHNSTALRAPAPNKVPGSCHTPACA